MTSSRRGESTAWPRSRQPLPAAASAADSGTASVEIDAATATVRRRGRLRAIVVTARPRQWVKNALVIAAPGAAGALGHDDVPVRVALACVAFCLISAGIYALNDCHDAAEDRLHPRKRLRPIAAGDLSIRDGVLIGVGLVVVGMVICLQIRTLLAVVALSYIVLTVSYTALWRHVALIDIGVVASGFMLRAIAGGVAAPVTLSRWFVLVVAAVALFIAGGKRQAELLRTAGKGGRRVMAHYTPGRLRLLLSASGGVALFAYCVWAFQLPTVHGIPWRLLTVIPFTVCLLRYGARVRAGAGEAPEEMLLSDRVLLLGGAAWLVLFALGVHAAS